MALENRKKILFNCCTDFKEPDWRQYTHLELAGCRDDDGQTDALVSAAQAQFLTVYGRLPSGEVEPITDINGNWKANGGHVLHLCATLSLKSRLTLMIHGSLAIDA